MGFLLFCVLVASYFEADRIFVADILRRKVKLSNGAPPFQKDKVFDLKTIGIAQTHSSLPQNKPASPVQEVQKSPPVITSPRPIIELTGSHIEHRTKESFGTILINILKNMFVWKSFAGKKKTDRENNNTEKQDAMKGTVRRVETITPTKSDKDTAPHYENVVADKYSSTSQKPVLRKTKAANKRGHSDFTHHESSGLAPHIGHIDRKQGNKTVHTPITDKKTADQVGTNKDKTTPPILTPDSNPFSASRQSSVGLDDFGK